jgi:hypothetical protein
MKKVAVYLKEAKKINYQEAEKLLAQSVKRFAKPEHKKYAEEFAEEMGTLSDVRIVDRKTFSIESRNIVEDAKNLAKSMADGEVELEYKKEADFVSRDGKYAWSKNY